MRRQHSSLAAWLLLPAALLWPGELPGQTSSCTGGPEFRGAAIFARGLLLRFDREPAYRILREGSNEVGPGGVRIWWAILEFPGATTASSPEWVSTGASPVLRFRSALFRRGEECGVRFSLEFDRYVPITLERRAEGFLLVTEPPVAIRPAGIGRTPSFKPSGGVSISGFVSTSRLEGSTTTSGSEGIGFYQEITNGGWLRGFVTHLFPRRDGGDTFGGLGLFGVPLGGSRADLLGGDISVPYAAPTQEAVDSPGQLLIRGGAAVLRRAADFRLFGFYGRSATPDTSRLAGTPILEPEISNDRVAGLFGYATAGFSTLGGGWVRSLPRGGTARDNFFESIGVAFSERFKLGAVVEESLSPEFGWQTTVSPKLREPRLYLGGYYRYASDSFLPALGSNFFAGLRRSFQLAGAWQASRALVFSAAAGQTRSFNLLDPRGVGTTTELENAAVNAQVSPGLTAGVFFNSTASRTDKGAVNPSDSRTNAVGVSAGASTRLFGVSALYSREETNDRVDPTFDFRSDRATLNLFSTLPGEVRASVLASYADSRRLNGRSAGRNYSLSAQLDKRFGRWLTAGVGAGEDVRPAGVATFGSTTTRLSAHFNAVTRSGLQVGGSYGYEDLRTTGGPSTKGYFASVFVSKSFSWGSALGPFADAGNRSFNLQETVSEVHLLGMIVLRAFLDKNGNSRPDQGEERLEGMEFVIDEVAYRTDARGFARASVPPGRYEVRLAVGRLPIRLSPSFPSVREAEVRGRETVTFECPFLSGGRVEGRVVLTGAPTPGASPLVSGLLIRLRSGATVLRETYTGEDGAFFFANVPPGRYGIELAEGIPEDYTVQGEKSIEIQITMDAAARPVFTLRRKTARERFGTLKG